MLAERREHLEGYRREAFGAWIALSAEADSSAGKFPTFPEFLTQLGIGEDAEEGLVSPERREDGRSRPRQAPARGGRGSVDTRTKDEIMAAAQKVADLDQRRLKKLSLLKPPEEQP